MSKTCEDYSPLVTGFEIRKNHSMMKPEHREKEIARIKMLKTQEHFFVITRVFIENDWMDKKITFDPFLSMMVKFEDETVIKYEIMSKFKEVCEDEDEYITDEERERLNKERERIKEDIRSRCTKIETPHGTIWLPPSPNLTQRRELFSN